ncbi:MAG: hypothetical protein ACM34I_12430 [bacterium]
MEIHDQSSRHDARISGELVLCDSDAAFRAHRTLFKFGRDRYVICRSSPVTCLETMKTSSGKLHLACRWKGMLSVTLWRDRIQVGDVLHVLKSVGMSERDLSPFTGAEIDDLFPALYYGKHFDVLRKVCNHAKKVAEGRLQSKAIRIDCHLVAEDSQQIVASSL